MLAIVIAILFGDIYDLFLAPYYQTKQTKCNQPTPNICVFVYYSIACPTDCAISYRYHEL